MSTIWRPLRRWATTDLSPDAPAGQGAGAYEHARARDHARDQAQASSGSEQHEDLAGIPEDLVLLDLEHVEAHRLRERPALADGDDVSLLRLEGRRAVGGHVGVALLETVKLLDVMQVVPADDDCALHLRRDHHALQDLAADAHVAGEGALLVDEIALLGLLRRREREADVAPVAHRALTGLLAEQPLGADEDGILLLVGLLGLIHRGRFRCTCNCCRRGGAR
mmetsp:Transcript_122297/g.391106  ORF Transcript_122297/g.391106 Transcript_122297/m.391106 type:complete len:223 (+) Transcript_122297:25-693(+)